MYYTDTYICSHISIQNILCADSQSPLPVVSQACGCRWFHHGGWPAGHAAGPHRTAWLCTIPLSADAAASGPGASGTATGVTVGVRAMS